MKYVTLRSDLVTFQVWKKKCVSSVPVVPFGKLIISLLKEREKKRKREKETGIKGNYDTVQLWYHKLGT